MYKNPCQLYGGNSNGTWSIWNPLESQSIGQLQDNIVKPYPIYVSGMGLYGVQCKINNNTDTVWATAFYLGQNDYPSDIANSWSGVGVRVADGYVLSPSIYAGKKESDNTFTGVMLGALSTTETEQDYTQNTGIYGFLKGNSTYGFKDDGTAYIGGSGMGRIEFDGTKGIIQSESYALQTSGQIETVTKGLQINLQEGTIKTPHFQVDADGNVKLSGNITWDIESVPPVIKYLYAAADTNGNAPSIPTGLTMEGNTTWVTSVPLADIVYVIITYDGGQTWYGPIRATGLDGAAGKDGAEGWSIDSQEREYHGPSNKTEMSDSIANTLTWKTEVPSSSNFTSSQPYLWTRIRLKYKKPIADSNPVAYQYEWSVWTYTRESLLGFRDQILAGLGDEETADGIYSYTINGETLIGIKATAIKTGALDISYNIGTNKRTLFYASLDDDHTVKIAGFKVTDSAIKTDRANGAEVDYGSTGPGEIYIGSSGIDYGGVFRVDSSGNLYIGGNAITVPSAGATKVGPLTVGNDGSISSQGLNITSQGVTIDGGTGPNLSPIKITGYVDWSGLTNSPPTQVDYRYGDNYNATKPTSLTDPTDDWKEDNNNNTYCIISYNKGQSWIGPFALGEKSKEVASIEVLYLASSTTDKNKLPVDSNAWTFNYSNALNNITTTNKYLWEKVIITYIDNSSKTSHKYTEPLNFRQAILQSLTNQTDGIYDNNGSIGIRASAILTGALLIGNSTNTLFYANLDPKDSQGNIVDPVVTIAGFQVSNKSLYTINNNPNDNTGVYLGTDGLNINNNFIVDAYGVTTLKDAILTGGVIASQKKPDNTSDYYIDLSNNPSGNRIQFGTQFIVEENGNVKLNNAVLTGGLIKKDDNNYIDLSGNNDYLHFGNDIKITKDNEFILGPWTIDSKGLKAITEGYDAKLSPQLLKLNLGNESYIQLDLGSSSQSNATLEFYDYVYSSGSITGALVTLDLNVNGIAAWGGRSYQNHFVIQAENTPYIDISYAKTTINNPINAMALSNVSTFSGLSTDGAVLTNIKSINTFTPIGIYIGSETPAHGETLWFVTQS